MGRFLGIDTSCYTTSVSLIEDNKIIIDKRIMLPVPEGSCGLRQSDGVFWHIKNLDKLFCEIALDGKIDAVGVSNAPRNVDGSYMPVFLPGVTTARAIASTHNIPFYTFSHQQGHIRAAMYSADFLVEKDEEYLAFHLSGGTSELLYIKGGKIDIVGGTSDLPAGQLIDRVGVYLGLPFPCGKHLEQLAMRAAGEVKVKTSVDGEYMNLSGIETKLTKQTIAPDYEIAYATLYGVGKSVEKVIINAKEKYKVDKVLIMGGVAANKQLRDIIGDKAYFGSGDLSRDNSVGIALLAQDMHLGQEV
ncbi:MAG: hypothetical protein PHE51_02905 [Eubacteriales bacterium]|nr:hypothetical protein [Eubacteriales bacterium]